MADPSESWFWLLVLGCAVVGGGWIAFRWLHIARMLEDTPTSRVRSAAQGYVELVGRAGRARRHEEPRAADATPRVWWKYRVQRRTGSSSGRNQRSKWQTVKSGHSEQPFLLDDGTGECIVQPAGAEVLTTETTTWYGDTAWPRRPRADRRLVHRGYRGKRQGTNQTRSLRRCAPLRRVADHNLIRLSSVIPTASAVFLCPSEEQLRGSFGDVLYCVYAVAHATERGDDAWAGIGWSLAADGSGRGLFVEHAGHSEEQVNNLINMSLADLDAGRPDTYRPEAKLLGSAHCHGQPVCAVVVATYRTAGWGEL